MSIADDGFLGKLRKNLQYAVQWLPKGAIKPIQVGSSSVSGQVLTTTANGAEWVTPTYNDSLLTTRGDLIRRGASAPERVALGVAGKTLRSDGTDAVWDDAAGSYVAHMYAAASGSPTHTNNGGWQKVGSGGGTLTWTSEFDKRPSGVSAQVDTATNKRIDIRKTGLYRIDGGVYFNTISDGKIVGIQIRKNGSATPVAQALLNTGVASGDLTPRVSQLVSLASGDYLELWAFQNDSVSEAYVVGTMNNVFLTAEYLGPAT